MNIQKLIVSAQTAAARAFPAPRIGTTLTHEEAQDNWMLSVLNPAGDIPRDPADWPSWCDDYCYTSEAPSLSSYKNLGDYPNQNDFPF